MRTYCFSGRTLLHGFSYININPKLTKISVVPPFSLEYKKMIMKNLFQIKKGYLCFSCKPYII